jgi:mono/diheme cytochrome c family protein
VRHSREGRRAKGEGPRRIGRLGRLGRLALLALLPLVASACEWFTDFKQQPSVKPWGQYSADSGELKGFRGQPAGSVSTHGSFAPGYAVSYANLNLATLDSFSTIANPVAADDRSLANGRKYFQVTCAACHGDLGDGNSTMKQLNPAYGFAPTLLLDLTRNRTDGYIWGMMRNGRNLMPPANRIGEMERWDVVNYVRGLQGKYAVATGPVGRPGETGDKLPGATRDAPTVPVKYFHPVVHPRPARASGAEAGADTRKPEGRP